MTEASTETQRASERWIDHLDANAPRYLLAWLALYFIYCIFTVDFYPSFSFPGGDEGTYLSYARHPWTLTSEFFEGFRPKEVQNPYNARLFLNPFSAVFAVFGYTKVGARLLCSAYGLLILVLVYKLVVRMSQPDRPVPGMRAFGLMAAVLLSLHEPFQFFTHGIRPEIMFSLGLLVCTWLLVRNQSPTPRTWFTLAFASSCLLMVHYNGVTGPPLFFAAALLYDRGANSLKKVLAFVGGGLAFLVVFFLVNFLPALDTVREFGILPVTFVSKNKIPITESLNLWQLFLDALDYYTQPFRNGSSTEPRAGLYSLMVYLPGIWFAIRARIPAARAVLLLLVLLVLVMTYILPNKRHDYAFYLSPLLFVCGISGLARLPLGMIRSVTAAALFVIVACGGLYWNLEGVRLFAGVAEQNEETNQAIAALVAQHGAQPEVTVMGTQEFREAIPDVRYRTFHSTIVSNSLDTALKTFEPHLVLLQKRSISWLLNYAGLGIDPTLPPDQRFFAARDYAVNTLHANGYRAVTSKRGQLYWNKSQVYIFGRKPK